jgi:WD40 repeat protein
MKPFFYAEQSFGNAKSRLQTTIGSNLLYDLFLERYQATGDLSDLDDLVEFARTRSSAILTPLFIGIFQTGTFELLENLEFPCEKVLFMPDGERLVVVTERDITVLYWRIRTQIFKLENVVMLPRQTRLLPNADIIAVYPDDKEMKIWDADTGCCKHTLDLGYLDHFSRYVACSANGRRIAVAAYYHVYVWDLEEADNWIQNQEIAVGKLVLALDLSADGRLIITAVHGNYIKIFVDTCTCVAVLRGHIDKIESLSLSSANRKLASGSSDKTVKIWDLSTIPEGNMGCNDSSIDSMAARFSPAGKFLIQYLISDAWFADTRIWYTDTGFKAAPVLSREWSKPNLVSFTPDDRLVAVTEPGRSLVVWDTTLGKEISNFTIPNPENVFFLS